MPTELILFVGDRGQDCFVRQPHTWRYLGYIPGQSWTVQHAALLGAYPHLPCRLVLYLQDMQFEVYDLPRIRGRSLHYLLKRRLAEWLPQGALGNLCRLHAVSGLRPEERYGLCWLPAEHALHALLTELQATQRVLSGLHTVSHCLRPYVHSHPRLLLVYLYTHNLHLDYWQQSSLYFSRCVALPASDLSESLLLQEISQTRLYLLSRQWLASHETLHVRLLSPLASGKQAQALMPENTHLEIISPAAIAAPIPALFASLLEQDYATLPNLATPEQLHGLRKQRLRQLGLVACLLWCLTGGAWSWFARQETLALAQQQFNIKTALQREARTNQLQPAASTPLQITPALIKQAAAFSLLSQHQRLPDRVWQLLGALQQSQACWQLDSLNWQTSDTGQIGVKTHTRRVHSAPDSWQEQVEIQFKPVCDDAALANAQSLALLKAVQSDALVATAQVQATAVSLPAQGDSSQPLPLRADLLTLIVRLQPPVLLSAEHKS